MWCRLPIFGLLLSGCGADKAAAPRYPMAEMTGLIDGAGWVWRPDATGSVDTGRDAALDPERLIWARHEGDGTISMRQGETHATGVAWGLLRFDTTGGDLVLAEWDLPGDSGARIVGTGAVRLADAEAADGDRHTTGAVTCETRVNERARTFFGTYEATVTLVCTGATDRPVGAWVFARDVGLVQLRSPVVVDLDLVRPGW